MTEGSNSDVYYSLSTLLSHWGVHAHSPQSCPTLCNPVALACQAPLSMRYSWQENWSGLPWPSPGDLPNPGVEPAPLKAPALQVDSLPLGHQGSPKMWCVYIYIHFNLGTYDIYHIIYTCIYTHKMKYSHKKEQNSVIFNTVDGLGKFYARWNKSDRERPISKDIACMCNLKVQMNVYNEIETHLQI